MTLEEQLLRIERQLWTNNAEFYHDHLVDDAMLVFGETGPIGRDVAVRRSGRRTPKGAGGLRPSSKTSPSARWRRMRTC